MRNLNSRIFAGGIVSIFSRVSVILLVAFYFGGQAAVVKAQTPSPVIFFTDIQSGPATGGESVSGFAGAYITIYGNNFGASQGASTITLNGSSCGRVVSWGTAHFWYQKIVYQLGPTCTTGHFVITVNGQA